MRIMINVEEDGHPRLIEEDIEIALRDLHPGDAEISEDDDGCFTVDMPGKFTVDAPTIASRIKVDTGAIVTVEVEPDW